MRWLVFVAVVCGSVDAFAQPLAFPGAVGFGATSEGGRGGDVRAVTSLADAGPGSLRDAITSATGPRTVVFETSGIIDLQSPLRILDADRLTLAGQTSPGGITLRGYPTEVIRSSHIVIRHLRFRPGDIHAAGIPGKPGQGNADLPGAAADALSILESDQVMIDHVSASWSMDETLSVTKSTNVTVSHSIISESLLDSFHPEGFHGRGSLVRGLGERGYTFYRNLWAHHRRRSPSLGGEQDPPPGEPGLGLDVDVVENVIYNWGLLPTHTLDDPRLLRVHWTGNTYVAGADRICPCIFLQIEGTADEVQLYQDGNYVDMDMDGAFAPRLPMGDEIFGFFTFFDEPFDFDRVPVPISSARRAFRRVLGHAGASRPRDAVDARIVREVKTQTGGHIDSQDEVGGWPELSSVPSPPADLDRDGMADAWELDRGLSPEDAEDRNGFDFKPGYTNLEIYLESLAR
ncbi:MAG: hypothetical protein OEP95_07895 [Myxococcales bacterium]|nr:hypothetical protein [Myxococcales bacterium]